MHARTGENQQKTSYCVVLFTCIEPSCLPTPCIMFNIINIGKSKDVLEVLEVNTVLIDDLY